MRPLSAQQLPYMVARNHWLFMVLVQERQPLSVLPLSVRLENDEELAHVPELLSGGKMRDRQCSGCPVVSMWCVIFWLKRVSSVHGPMIVWKPRSMLMEVELSSGSRMHGKGQVRSVSQLLRKVSLWRPETLRIIHRPRI